MKLSLFIMILAFIGCREKNSSEEITKPQLREQIQTFQNPSDEVIQTRMDTLSTNQREILIRATLPKIDRETMEKLLFSEEFQKSLETIVAKIQDDLKIEIEVLKKEQMSLDELGIKAKRKLTANFNWKIKPIDPELSFKVETCKRKYKCSDIQKTTGFWKQFLSITQNKKFLLVSSKEMIEETIKTCLLFHRLKDNLETCEIERMKELEQICQLGADTEENGDPVR